jgi:hypothetical protein
MINNKDYLINIYQLLHKKIYMRTSIEKNTNI